MSHIWPTEHTEDTEDEFVSVSSVCSVGKFSETLAPDQPL